MLPTVDTEPGAGQATRPLASLYNKFDELEKKWLLYNKFDNLERRWNQLNGGLLKDKKLETIQIEADLNKKWDQLSALSKDDQTHDSDEESQQSSEGSRSQRPENEDPMKEVEPEPGPEEPVTPCHDKPGFTLKKRTKRPRRLLKLTNTRSWNMGNHKHGRRFLDAAVPEDEEVLFGPSESRDELNSYKEDAEDRVLSSMPNLELWQPKNYNAMPSESTTFDFAQFITGVEKEVPRTQQETIVFASPRPFQPEMWGIRPIKSENTDRSKWHMENQHDIEPERGWDGEQRSMIGEIEVLSADGREQIQRCETITGDIELWVKEQISLRSSRSASHNIESWVKERMSQKSSSKSVHSCESIQKPKEQMYALKGYSGSSPSQEGDGISAHSQQRLLQLNDEMSQNSSSKSVISSETNGTSKSPENHLQCVVRELLRQRLYTVSAVMIQSWIRMKIVQRAYQRSIPDSEVLSLPEGTESSSFPAVDPTCVQKIATPPAAPQTNASPSSVGSGSPSLARIPAPFSADIDSLGASPVIAVVPILPKYKYPAAPAHVSRSAGGPRRRRDVLMPTVAQVQFLRKAQIAKRYQRCATTIQSIYRRRKCRIAYVGLIEATVKVQRACRPFLFQRKRIYAATRIQRFWLHQNKVTTQWSFDGTDISTLTFDNSYCNEEPPLLSSSVHRPHAVLWTDRKHLPLSSSIAHVSCLALRRKGTSYHHDSALPPRPPCFPQIASPSLDLSYQVSYHQNRRVSSLRRGEDLPKTSIQTCIDQRRIRGPSCSPLRSKMHGRRGPLSGSSSIRTGSRSSPLAVIVSGTAMASDKPGNIMHDAAHQSMLVKQERRSIAQGRQEGKKYQGHLGMTADGTGKGTRMLGASETNAVREQISGDILPFSQEPWIEKAKEKIHECIEIQRIWRGYRAKLQLISKLVLGSAVRCECSKGRIQRNRVLRQRAQLMALRKAIGQASSFGVNARLSFGKKQIIMEWASIIYVNVAGPDGQVINTVSKLCAESAIRRALTVNALSKQRLANLMVKAALEGHLREQQNRISRTSLFERSLSRRRAPVEREAATQIQKLARRCLAQRTFLLRKGCALVVQQKFRCWRVKKIFGFKRKAAIKIQSFFKGELVRGIVFQFWVAATALRGFWNEHRQKRLLEADANASNLQRAFRAMKSRQLLRVQILSATVIQTEFRSTAARRRFLVLRRFCYRLQTFTRRRIGLRLKRERSSAVCIQRWWRFEQCNRMMQSLCASIISSAFRKYRAFCQYHQVRNAVVIIQRSYRAFSDREMLNDSHQSAIIVQRNIRRVLQRTALALSIRSSLLISSWYRGVRKRQEYYEVRRRAIAVQTLFRRRREKKAAVKIQAMWRSFYHELIYSIQLECIIAIQTRFRVYREQQFFQRKQRASSRVQRRWQTNRSRFSFLVVRGAAIFLQRIWRKRQQIERKRSAKAIRLQAVARRRRVLKNFHTVRFAAIMIASFFRKFSQRQKYAQLRHATIAAQVCIRKFIQTKRYRLQRKRIILFQTLFRAWSQCKKYKNLVKCITWSQKVLRRYLRARQHHMATIIQAKLRKVHAQKAFDQFRRTALLIQRNWRMVAARSSYPRLRETKIRSAVMLQSWYRCNISRFKFLIDVFSIVTVQTIWRTHRQEREYRKLKGVALWIQDCYRQKITVQEQAAAAILIQCFLRRAAAHRRRLALLIQKQRTEKVLQVRARRKARFKASKKKEFAARHLQNAYRNHLERKTAATMIQKAWRCHLCTKRFAWQKKCACVISHKARAFLARARFLRIIIGMIRFQGIARGVANREGFLKIKRATVLIQSYMRGLYCRHQMDRKLKAILMFQSIYCMVRIRVEYRQKRIGSILMQSLSRKRLCRSRYLKARQSAVIIQKFYRRAVIRKSYIRIQMGLLAFQSQWRKLQCQRFYAKLRQRFVFVKTQAQLWHSIKMNAVILLQRAIRSFAKKSYYKRLQAGTVVIQHLWRCRTQFKKYVRFCLSLVHLQRQWRHTQYHARKLRNSRAATIQNCWRIYSIRKVRSERAGRIQSTFRGYRLRRQFRLQRAATISIQTWYRCCVARFELLIKVICATIIQSIYRGYRKRLCYAKVKVAASRVLHFRSAVVLQDQWRKTSARNSSVRSNAAMEIIQRSQQSQAKSQLRHRSALLVQNQWRRAVARSKYHNMHSSFVSLQKLWRHNSLRRRSSTAETTPTLILQREWHRQLLRCEFLKKRRAIVSLQSQWRRRILQALYTKVRRGVSILQVLIQQRYCLKIISVRLLQRNWRMSNAKYLKPGISSQLRNGEAPEKESLMKNNVVKALYWQFGSSLSVERDWSIYFYLPTHFRPVLICSQSNAYYSRRPVNKEARSYFVPLSSDIKRNSLMAQHFPSHHNTALMSKQVGQLQKMATSLAVFQNCNHDICNDGISIKSGMVDNSLGSLRLTTCMNQEQVRLLQEVATSMPVFQSCNHNVCNDFTAIKSDIENNSPGSLRLTFYTNQKQYSLLQKMATSTPVFQDCNHNICNDATFVKVGMENNYAGSLLTFFTKQKQVRLLKKMATNTSVFQNWNHNICNDAMTVESDMENNLPGGLQLTLYTNQKQVGPLQKMVTSAPVLQNWNHIVCNDATSIKSGMESSSPGSFQLTFYTKQKQARLIQKMATSTPVFQNGNHNVCIDATSVKGGMENVSPDSLRATFYTKQSLQRVMQTKQNIGLRAFYQIMTQTDWQKLLKSKKRCFASSDKATSGLEAIPEVQLHISRRIRFASPIRSFESSVHRFNSQIVSHDKQTLSFWMKRVCCLLLPAMASVYPDTQAVIPYCMTAGVVFSNSISTVLSKVARSGPNIIILFTGDLLGNVTRVPYGHVFQAGGSLNKGFQRLSSPGEKETGKYVVMVCFLFLSAIAQFVGCPLLRSSFMALCLSVLIQSPSDSALIRESAATWVQSLWRRHRAQRTFLKTRMHCIVLQREFRKYRQVQCYSMSRRAAIQIQRFFRSYRTASRSKNEVVEVKSPKFEGNKPLGFWSSIMLASKFYLVSWALTLVVTFVEARNACRALRLGFFILQLLGAKLVMSKIYREQQAALQRQLRCITIIQRAFRRRRALRKWKEHHGFHEREQTFFSKLVEFRSRIENLKEEVVDGITRSPESDVVENEEISELVFPRIVVEFYSEERAAHWIQSWWRASFLKRSRAASLIQAVCRSHSEKQKFAKCRNSTWMIQQTWRRNVGDSLMDPQTDMESTLRELLIRRQRIVSSIVLQRWFRGVREGYHKDLAADRIAKWWKTCRIKEDASRRESAVSTLQRAVRKFYLQGHFRSQASCQGVLQAIERRINTTEPEITVGERYHLETEIMETECGIEITTASFASGGSQFCGCDVFLPF